MRYVTARELADALGVSTKTVDRWLAAGQLPPPVRGKGPRGADGWRRWPVSALLPTFRAQGRPVPAEWAEPAAA